MPSFQTTRAVRHSPVEMFDLVADVERYPEFLPLCQSLRIRRRSEVEPGVEALVAEMAVGYKAIRESFTTRVTLDRPQLTILTEYVEGPFRHLNNRWRFRPDPLGCAIEFFIDYEFRSYALSLLMGSMFDGAFRRFSVSFEERADVVYGERSPQPV